MPLALSSCFCCFPKLLNHSLREHLVTHASSGGTGADAAAEQQQQPAAAGAAMQSSASLQRLLAHGIISSCPNLHLLEENAALQQQQQQQQQQQAAQQGSKSLHSKPVVRSPGSPQIERSSSQEAPSAAPSHCILKRQQPLLPLQCFRTSSAVLRCRPCVTAKHSCWVQLASSGHESCQASLVRAWC